MEGDKINQTLAKIIKKQYLPKYRDWHETATSAEIKGVSILEYIMKTRGHQKADKTVMDNKKNVKDLLNQQFKYSPHLTLITASRTPSSSSDRTKSPQPIRGNSGRTRRAWLPNSTSSNSKESKT